MYRIEIDSKRGIVKLFIICGVELIKVSVKIEKVFSNYVNMWMKLKLKYSICSL